MLLAPHRQVRHSHRFIHYGTPALPAAAPLPRERFSRVLGMFSSLEVKVLYPTRETGLLIGADG